MEKTQSALGCSGSNVTALSVTTREMNVRNQYCQLFFTSFVPFGPSKSQTIKYQALPVRAEFKHVRTILQTNFVIVF